MMSGALPRQGVSDYIRKQNKQAVERKPFVVFLHDLCFKLPSWVPALVSLSDGLWHGSVSQMDPFFLHVLSGPCFIIASGSN